MANSTLHDDYRVITSTNREYQRNRDRWEFLMYSYVGGEEYRRQGYLTKYQLETGAEYNQRLMTTPLDNHCQSVIGVYISYLFRENPEREMESWEYNPSVKAFLEDADMDGRTLDHFMKDVAIWSSVFGHCWIVMTKPNVGAQTLGEEQMNGVRPYVNLITPLAVMDWKWSRQPNGAYELTYLKYVEEVVDKSTTIRTWTKDTIETWITDENSKEAVMTISEPNQLGMIPAVIAYNKRSIVRGLGVSDIADIADIQRLIYNYNSEIEQSIRLDGHPSLVVTPDTQYGSGAGAVIVIPENSDPGLKPYVLEHGGANVASIHDSVRQLVEAIDRLSNTGGVRGVETRTLSGVAMEVEFSLLNARLAEKADNLQLAEEQMWKIFARYQGLDYDVEIEYPGSFNVRDTQREFQQLSQAKSAATDPRVLQVIDYKIVELLGEEADYILPEVEAMTEKAEMADELEDMVEEGLITPEQAVAALTETTSAEGIIAESMMGESEMLGEACPIATQDIAVNLANRQTAIDTANYGPLNPNQPNRVFWMALADKWSVTEAQARQSTCGNCAAFNITSKIENCIEQGLAAGGATGDEWDTVNAGELGYCEAFDFKCASNRTCDAWVVGGPIED